MSSSFSRAFFPQTLERTNAVAPWAGHLILIVGGSLFVALLARVSIPLGFTPVPITGQTFSVYLLSMLWGRRLATAAFFLYLVEAWAGLPVLAGGASGLTWGPTLGYLLGMFLACQFVGAFADLKPVKSFWSSVGACLVGSVCILSVGAFVLSFFLPRGLILPDGIYPFLPGEVIKICLVGLIVTQVSKRSINDRTALHRSRDRLI